MKRAFPLVITSLLLLVVSVPASAQLTNPYTHPKEPPKVSEEYIRNSANLYKADDLEAAGAEVFYSVMQMPSIPQSIFVRARAIAVFPSKLKFGAPIEKNRSGGLVSIRNQQTGQWEPPVFIYISGGNIGDLLAEEENNLILIALNPRAANSFLTEKFNPNRIYVPQNAVEPIDEPITDLSKYDFVSYLFNPDSLNKQLIGINIENTFIQPDTALNSAVSWAKRVERFQPVSERVSRSVSAFPEILDSYYKGSKEEIYFHPKF